MATEYKCDICGKPATVHITKIIDNKKIKVHLCSACAEKASMDIPTQFLPTVQQIEAEIMATQKTKLLDKCPTCGASISEMEKGARFSCPDCYAAMGARLTNLFTQMHNATRHTGKTPKYHEANASVSADALAENIQDNDDSNLDEDLLELESLTKELVEETMKLGAKVHKEIESAKKSAKKTSPKTEESESLEEQLARAIKEERYEDAAKLRDKINSKS